MGSLGSDNEKSTYQYLIIEYKFSKMSLAFENLSQHIWMRFDNLISI
jgi:hypothetical protein